MILILSETFDNVTDTVCSWLNYYGKKFVRINQDNSDVIEKITIDKEGVDIFIKDTNNNVYNLKEFNAFWNRRGYFKTNITVDTINASNHIRQWIGNHLYEEANNLFSFVYNYFKDFKCVNNPLHYNVNKLIVLKIAKEVDLSIPSTLITNNIENVYTYNEIWGDLITKNIANGICYFENGVFISQGTELIKPSNIKKSTSFFYSLFQENIIKKYELRIFFIGNNYYTAAIFSQQSKITKIDFRNYDTNKENIIVPFNLPKEIKSKLKKLMKRINLNSGSIDMIVTTNDEYCFLEVNPVGQFEWISNKCNFYLEREIARFL